MEVSVQNCESSDLPKKQRSLDLKSVYVEKPRGLYRKPPSKSLKRRSSSPLDDSRKKRRRKEASLSSFGLKTNALSSGVGKPEKLNDSGSLSDGLQNFGSDSALGPLKKNDSGSIDIKNSGISSGLGDGVIVPKRPRCILRQRKLEKGESSKTVKHESKLNDESRLNDELFNNVASSSQISDGNKTTKSPKIKKELSADAISSSIIADCKERKKNTDVNNELPTDVALSSLVLNSKRKKKSANAKENGSARDSSVARRRKKKNTSLVREKHVEDETPLLGNNKEFYGDFLEDDLEQNAARMLSSRFDPSCTGFSENKTPLSQSTNGFHGDFYAQSESYSVDDPARTLRPRKRNGKSLFRKRRHFYEVSYRDMDPYCILKQRIRVFWPLDNNWYFGLVKDYDPVTSMHHVKYDDREEEWIDLRNERFKLLLFPSEIPGKLSSGRPRVEVKQDKEGDNKALDASLGTCTESEPIIAWLPSKHRRKLSEVNMRNRRRTHLLNDFESSISSQLKGQLDVIPSNLFPKIEETSQKAPEVMSSNSFSDREPSFVYFRRKFHKRREALDNLLEHDSVHGCSAASINILASVADSASVLEELDVFGSSMELTQATSKFTFRKLGIHDLAFGIEGSLCHALLLTQFGKLVIVWPMVRMEIVLVDNAIGARLLLFEGSLMCTVVLLCLIFRYFCWHSNGSRYKETRMPFTSIGINLSGLHDKDGKILFFMYKFLKIKSSKLRYLENKLKRQCVAMRVIPILQFTSSTFKNLQDASDQFLYSSMYKDAVSLVDFSGSSYSNSLLRVIPDKTLYWKNSTVCFINANNGRSPQNSIPFAYSHSFILRYHIKSLIENNATSVGLQEQNSSSSQESPDTHEKSTINGCSSVEEPSDPVSDITMENLGPSLDQAAASSGKLSAAHLKVETDTLSASDDGDKTRSSHNSLRNEANISGNSSSSYPEDSSSPEKSEGGYNQIQSIGQTEQQSNDKGTLDLAWEINRYSLQSLNPTAPRSIRHSNGHSSRSPKYGLCSKSFNGLKKRRTQVSYSLPFGGYDLGSKRRSHQRKPRSFKTDKSHTSNSRSNQDSSICIANVLVTVGDKGWREYGAQAVLESNDKKEWNICVKFSGIIKYVYKAQHILQPGITNRYTHAMMWKGGKDWTLEFTDRVQWSTFKEIHEECYNRNIRASYVRNIPIPGVRLIADEDDENNDFVSGLPYVRSSLKYHRQVGTEVDTALDPAHVLYDMDSDDEAWVSEMRNSVETNEDVKVTDEMFERVMDVFEKFAYAQQCDEFSSDEIEEFMDDVGSPEIVKTIYEHWRQKRLKKGMPLIRQFQPALWERYQQQLKEWESTVSRTHNFQMKKPPMFAFFLRPRGLEVPNKLLKQRSHKKFVSKASPRAFSREQDGFHPFGRRTNGTLLSIPSYESSDSYHSNDDSEKSQYLELYRTNSKKSATYTSPRDFHIMPFSQNKKFNPVIYESPNMNQIQRDGLRRHRADIDELKLRDASNAANHAVNMAKMKREKAQWLIHKADLALHKASAALMIAEAMKDSEKDLIGEG